MYRWITGAMLGALLLILTACGGASTPEPTAIPSPTTAPTATPAPTVAPTTAPTTAAVEEPTAAPAAEPAPAADATVVDFWTSDNEPKRVAVYRSLADRYMAEHPGVTVNVIPYVESTTLQQLEAAEAAGELPDLIRVGIEWVAALDGADLLDTDAARAVVQAVGEADFREGVLSMVTDTASGDLLAVPYDGWIQALWYRRDLLRAVGAEDAQSVGSISTPPAIRRRPRRSGLCPGACRPPASRTMFTRSSSKWRCPTTPGPSTTPATSR